MEQHTLIILLSGLVLCWGGSLWLVRHWTRRRLLESLMEQEAATPEGPDAMLECSPMDRQAQDIIRTYRRRYLLKLWRSPAFSFKGLNDLGLELIQEIARVYYPLEERPELKASLADLVALYNRIGTRLAALLESLPMRPFKDVELQTVVRYHGVYQDVKNHAVTRFIQRHRLYRVMRWGWAAYNYANPWYWGRKALLEGSKEVVSRLALARLADIIGEEAICLYGRRPVTG